jgi:hypothetical protein
VNLNVNNLHLNITHTHSYERGDIGGTSHCNHQKGIMKYQQRTTKSSISIIGAQASEPKKGDIPPELLF